MSRGVGTCFAGVLLGLAVYVVVPEVWLAVLRGVEQVIQLRVDNDVAVVLSRSRCGTGSRGTGWGEQRGRGGGTGRRWGSLVWQSRSVE